jgi:colanic acid/amylovoran biosynthesis glycosyltransferase
MPQSNQCGDRVVPDSRVVSNPADMLVVIPGVPIGRDSGRLFIDIKALEGLRMYAALWPGPVRCVFREGDVQAMNYGKWCSPSELPFEVICVSPGARADDLAIYLRDAAVVSACADNHLDLGFVDIQGARIVYTIEYTFQTRLAIARLEGGSLIGKAKGMIWSALTELKRRRAMRLAAAIQANGMPAFHSFRSAQRNDLLFFDTRLTAQLYIGKADGDEKADRLAARNPLRVAFSGRLDPMKGADHLIPVIAYLHGNLDCRVQFEIFGDGSLRESILLQIAQSNLQPWVKLHGPVDFAGELVPHLKESVDVFLCCHRQADPSCTYLETLGCGVPIVGYLNDAFKGVLELGGCGIGVPMDDVRGAAEAIKRLHLDRQLLGELTRGAVAVAGNHLFEDEFRTRVNHLREVSGL